MKWFYRALILMFAFVAGREMDAGGNWILPALACIITVAAAVRLAKKDAGKWSE